MCDGECGRRCLRRGRGGSPIVLTMWTHACRCMHRTHETCVCVCACYATSSVRWAAGPASGQVPERWARQVFCTTSDRFRVARSSTSLPTPGESHGSMCALLVAAGLSGGHRYPEQCVGRSGQATVTIPLVAVHGGDARPWLPPDGSRRCLAAVLSDGAAQQRGALSRRGRAHPA